MDEWRLEVPDEGVADYVGGARKLDSFGGEK